MMTQITDKQFRLYAPQSTKSYTTNDDGSLIIEGIASTTNKDLTGDVVLPSAIKSMKQQLTTTTKNLHGDHKYGLDGILGVVKEVVETDDDRLAIRAVIRKTYAPVIKEMLDIGVNLGLSIGGNVKDYTPTTDGWEIKDINLFEISLTGMPANWDTYGTITSKNDSIVESKCLAGACHTIRKQLEVNRMPEENNQQQEDTTEYLTVEDVTNLFNELMADKQKEIANQTLETVRNEMDKQIRDTVEDIMGGETEGTATSEDDDKIKSIIESTLTKSLDGFFEKLNNNRTPAPHVDKALEKVDEAKEGAEVMKTYTPEEAAKELYKKTSSQNSMILNMLNQQ